MGKRYHCDYCNKTMSASPSIIKTHNKGLVHQKLVLDHYQLFKDPELILNEESKKKPCSKLSRGECQFGSMCRFSHYSYAELQQLREIVNQRNLKYADKTLPSFIDLYRRLQDEKSKLQHNKDQNTILLDQSGMTHVLPWTYSPVLERYDNLPPSIRKLKIEDFRNAQVTTW